MALYEILDAARQKFRLCRLCNVERSAENGVEDGISDIVCELRVLSMQDVIDQSWTAVSYRWGDEVPSKTITIDETSLLVRANLYAFLQQMQSERCAEWLFVDAICINQEDVVEKAAQVNLMGDVFRHAKQVMVWLGQHRTSETEAGESPSNDYLLEEASTNEYWTRLWIVQEVTLARRLIVRLGAYQIDWWKIVRSNSNVVQRDSKDRPVRPPVENLLRAKSAGAPQDENMITVAAVQILSWREGPWLTQGRRLPFWQAILFFSNQACSVPHDRIFGLLGIAESRIRSDYGMTILDLYTATLADFYLSLGFITTEASTNFYWRIIQMTWAAAKQGVKTMEWLAPMTIFDLDPFHPAVCLATLQVGKFFAPGWEEALQNLLVTNWHNLVQNSIPDRWVFDMDDWNFRPGEDGWITGFKKGMEKKMASDTAIKSSRKQLEALARCDGVMISPGKDGESRTYTQWTTHFTEICENLWDRYQSSGNAPSVLDEDDSWTLVG